MVTKTILGLGRVKLGKVLRCTEEARCEEPLEITDHWGLEVGIKRRVEVAANSSIVAGRSEINSLRLLE